MIDPDKALATFISEHTSRKDGATQKARADLIVATDYIESLGGDPSNLRLALELEEEKPDRYEFTPEAVEWVIENTIQSGRIEGDHPEQAAIHLLMGDALDSRIFHLSDGVSMFSIIGGMVETYGIEYINLESPSDEVEDLRFEYLDSGDTHDKTLIIEGREVDTGTHGDMLEEWERELAEEGWTRDDGGWTGPVEIDLGLVEAEITAFGADSEAPDVPGAVDAEISYDEVPIGEVTLVPDHLGNLNIWGDLDMWAGGTIQEWLDTLADSEEGVDAIVATVRDAPGGPPDEMSIVIPSWLFEDHDNMLEAADAKAKKLFPKLEGWLLHPQWGDEDRESIVLTVPYDIYTLPKYWSSVLPTEENPRRFKHEGEPAMPQEEYDEFIVTGRRRGDPKPPKRTEYEKKRFEELKRKLMR